MSLRGFRARNAADEEFLRTLPQKISTLERITLVGYIKFPLSLHKLLGLPRCPEKRLAAMRLSRYPLGNYCNPRMDVGAWERLARCYTLDVGVALLKTKTMSRWREWVAATAGKENLVLEFSGFNTRF